MPVMSRIQLRARWGGTVLAALLAISAVARAEPNAPPNAMRYDADYPTIPYSGVATHNVFHDLQGRIDRGELKLEVDPQHGYLDALLKALHIDPSSQVMVYSKTSLQISLIAAATPRAIYFNDDTYVGYVQNAPLMELATVDSDLGTVFYTMVNHQTAPRQFDREAGRCLTCHDTYSMMGGGVPRVVVMSSVVDGPLNPADRETSDITTDKTPLRERWGGWYVSGNTGKQTHLGNLPVDDDPHLAQLPDSKRFNLPNLDSLFNTKPYLSNKSDVVALLVLEHQTNVVDLITRASFKVRTMLARSDSARSGPPRSWEDLSAGNQKALRAMIEPLVQAMLFVDAADYGNPISGTAGFEANFQSRGIRDPKGRSLRDFDLQTRLFKYPLSYMVYSKAFDSLPDYVRQYVYLRFAQILRGQDTTGPYADISAEDRRNVLEILTATKPEFAAFLNGPGAGVPVARR